MAKSEVKGAGILGDIGNSAFNRADFLRAAEVYRDHKRLIDAMSGCDNLEDAIAKLREAHTIIADMVERGAEYTPGVDLGFGSDNAKTIGEVLLGMRPTTGAVRKAFVKLAPSKR